MEVLVVVAIMGIMAVAVVPGYSSNKRTKAMNFAKTQIINDMKYVQNSTLSGMKIPGDRVSRGGFGINIVKGNNYFIIFGDENANKEYDAGTDGIVEKVFLEGGVFVSELKEYNDRYGNGTGNDHLKINYVCVPPYGASFIDSSGGDQEVIIKITLSSPDGKMQSSFFISSTGYTSYTG